MVQFNYDFIIHLLNYQLFQRNRINDMIKWHLSPNLCVTAVCLAKEERKGKKWFICTGSPDLCGGLTSVSQQGLFVPFAYIRIR